MLASPRARVDRGKAAVCASFVVAEDDDAVGPVVEPDCPGAGAGDGTGGIAGAGSGVEGDTGDGSGAGPGDGVGDGVISAGGDCAMTSTVPLADFDSGDRTALVSTATIARLDTSELG